MRRPLPLHDEPVILHEPRDLGQFWLRPRIASSAQTVSVAGSMVGSCARTQCG